MSDLFLEGASPKVKVLPVVFFSILDHYLRRAEAQNRVIGTLLGTITGNNVEVRRPRRLFSALCVTVRVGACGCVRGVWDLFPAAPQYSQSGLLGRPCEVVADVPSPSC